MISSSGMPYLASSFQSSSRLTVSHAFSRSTKMTCDSCPCSLRREAVAFTTKAPSAHPDPSFELCSSPATSTKCQPASIISWGIDVSMRSSRFFRITIGVGSIINSHFDFSCRKVTNTTIHHGLCEISLHALSLIFAYSKAQIPSNIDRNAFCKWLVVVVLLLGGVLILATQKIRREKQRVVCPFLFRPRDCSFCYPLSYALRLMRYERGRE